MSDVEREDVPVLTVDDDVALLSVVEQLFPPMLGITLSPVPGDALAADTEFGTLFVGALGDFVVSLELRMVDEYEPTFETLAALNERNASTSFVTFSVLDEALWLSASVDGNPLVPAHLARVLSYMFQAAALVMEDSS